MRLRNCGGNLSMNLYLYVLPLLICLRMSLIIFLRPILSPLKIIIGVRVPLLGMGIRCKSRSSSVANLIVRSENLTTISLSESFRNIIPIPNRSEYTLSSKTSSEKSLKTGKFLKLIALLSKRFIDYLLHDCGFCITSDSFL